MNFIVEIHSHSHGEATATATAMVKIEYAGRHLAITLRTSGGITLKESLLKVEEICKSAETDLCITFYKDWHRFRELLAFSRAIICGFENNPRKDTVILTVHAGSAGEDFQHASHIGSMNAGILAVRRQSNTYDETLSKALQEIPSSCESVTQTKDKRLFLDGLVGYITNLKGTSEDKTSQEVFSGIADFIQTVKEIKEEDTIYVTNEDWKCLSISQCVEDLRGCGYEHNIPAMRKLYRTREFEKCKLGVVHYLAAVMDDDSDVMNMYMYRNFSHQMIDEFQDGENGVYPHINAIFTKVLASENFHYCIRRAKTR